MENNTRMYRTLAFENKVIATVKAAAELIKDTCFKIHSKDAPANIVTTSDLLAQNFLQRELSVLIPSAGFIGEENLTEISEDYTWVIDPIDGTMNYSRGIAECAVSVGLLYKSDAILGVVYNIFTDDVFSACIGLGARLNGKVISVSKNSFENGLLCTAMSTYKKEFAKICDDIIYEVYMQCNDYRRFGSCAIELCYLAAGMCDLYFEIRVFPWDYAAAYLILKEAGGSLGGLLGEKLKFNKPTALIGANNAENYEKLQEIVSKHIEKLPYGD